MNTDPRRGLPSCSALYRLRNCPASHRLGKDAEAAGLVPPAGPEADSGTRIHRYLETETDSDFEALSHDERETAEICESIRTLLITAWIAPSGPNVEHFKERRLGLTRLGAVCKVTDENTGVDFILTGMADHIVIDRHHGRGLVIDYKTGRGDVDRAADNDQLRGLAVLAAGMWNLKCVRVAIIQPMAGAPTVADYDESLIDEAQILLEMVCEETDRDHDPRAGDWCQYCPARAICPALRDEATSAPESLEIETLAADPATARSALVARALEFPAEKLAGLLRGRRMIGWYLHAIEAAARIILERGEPLPGFELRDRKCRRSIADTDAAATVLAPLLASAEGGAQAALLRCATLRPKAVQDEIQIASGRKSKTRYNLTVKDAKAHMENALGDLMAQKISKVLAPVGEAIEDEEGEE